MVSVDRSLTAPVQQTNSAIALESLSVNASFTRSSDITGVRCSQLTSYTLA